MQLQYFARTLRCFLILFLISGIPASQVFAAQPKPVICSQEYALCTSAPCIPDPRHPGYALCSCVVEKGDNAGYSACNKRIPTQDQFKVTRLLSTFSFEQFSSKKALNCAKGNPWTDCVDSPCSVNPMDPTKAICSCKILHAQAFFTFGGDCNVNTCATGFWSGNTTAAGAELRNAMFAKQHITKNPWPDSSCPISH